jgi:hypothetical protein
MEKAEYEKIVKSDTLNGFIASLTMSGGGTPDDRAFFTSFNILHGLEYFTPNTTRNIHIFMTRPHCNINPTNIAADASFLQCCYSETGNLLLASLMAPSAIGITDEKSSTYLDDATNGNIGAKSYTKLKENGIKWMGFTPFIPIVSNLSTGISGIKDVTMDKYEYEGDLVGNKPIAPMGLDNYRASGEFSINYIEHTNLSVSMFHLLWLLYMDKVGKGLMSPTEEHIKTLVYDYMSSVYWFITGEDGMSIKLYGKQTGIFPLDVPISSLIPSERGSPVDPKMTFNYAYNHAEVMNPEIINDFNFTVDRWLEKAPSGNAFENGPRNINNLFKQWRADNFLVHPPNLPGADEWKNVKYHRCIPYGRSGNNNTYQGSVFVPEPQNQWNGHPYIINGKLVYRALYGGNTPRSNY